MYDFFGRTIQVGDEVLYPRSNHVMMLGEVVAVNPDSIDIKRIATSDNRWCRQHGASRGARLINPKLKPYRLRETYACHILSGKSNSQPASGS